MARVYYVDTAIPSDRKKRRKNKTHVVFDGDRTFKVNRLTELEDAGEVFIDTLFPEIYDEVVELLRRGVRVYLLKDATKLKRLRMENNLKKTDENDAMLLSRIPQCSFKQITFKEMILLRLIEEYERYVEWRMVIRRWYQIHPLNSFKECIRELRSLCERHARKIIREVRNDESYGTIYRAACEALGIENSVHVAILIVKLPLNWKLAKLKGLLGLTPHSKKHKKYNHKLRANLSNIAANIYLNYKRLKTKPEILQGLENLPMRKTIFRLEIRILKALKRAKVAGEW
ncbi:MAG: hypothetical protein L2C94_003405 [Aigarchaeota archaeon]|nr:hypothetical protein [Candidatus Wolframiiraptor gerlachensis]